MLPADWMEYVAELTRDLKRAPDPLKRRQPKVIRHESAEMRTAGRQTRNAVRAIYVPESKYNVTPTRPNEWRGVEHEVGPHDRPIADVREHETVVEVRANEDGTVTAITTTVKTEIIDARGLAGKTTTERRAGANDGMNKQTPRTGGAGARGKKTTQTDLDKLVEHYLTGGD